MWRNLLVFTVLTTIFSVFSFIAIRLPVLAPLATNIYYALGFPYFLSAFLAISLLTFSAGLAKYLRSIAIPGAPIGFLAKLFLVLVDPSPLSSNTWIILGFTSLFFVFLSFVGLFPRCVSSNEIAVFLEISKGGEVIDSLYPLDTAFVEPGTNIGVKNVFETPTYEIPPPMTCNWFALGDGQYRPQNTMNCTVKYDTGIDNTIDVLTVTPKQAHCSSLGSYHFYFETSQHEMEEDNE